MRRFLMLIGLACTQLIFGTAQDKVFQEYGIRGVVGEGFLVSDSYEIGAAIATYFKQNDLQGATKQVILGADGRIHSPAIKQEMAKALQECGYDVVDIGTCTTPALYFALHQTEEASAGIMITASHNSGEYNGMKICFNKKLIPSKGIQEIKEIYKTKSFYKADGKRGNLSQADIISPYIDYLCQLFPNLRNSSLKFIVDCGNGAAGTVLPLLVEKMNWENAELLYAEVDGNFPHHIADPSAEKNMQDLKKALEDSNADFGLGLDGDGDRMGAITKFGRLIKGDELIAFYSKKVLQEYPGSAVVFDISSSLAMFNAIKDFGGIPYIAKTGVKNVEQLMDEKGALLGGEMSCHIIFKDRYFGYDDGVYSLLRFLELVEESATDLEEMLAELPVAYTSPTLRLPCSRETCDKIVEELKEKFYLLNSPQIEIITIDGLRVNFLDGSAIVRASNTEPVISIRFEGNSIESLLKIKNEFSPIISHYLGEELIF